jgi:hypothetical protein
MMHVLSALLIACVAFTAHARENVAAPTCGAVVPTCVRGEGNDTLQKFTSSDKPSLSPDGVLLSVHRKNARMRCLDADLKANRCTRRVLAHEDSCNQAHIFRQGE